MYDCLTKRDRCKLKTKLIKKLITKEQIIAAALKPSDESESTKEFAHSLLEKRGYVRGNEMQVWLDAEKTYEAARKAK